MSIPVEEVKKQYPWNKGRTGVYSAEVRARMSASHIGLKQSQKQINNRVAKLKGRICSDYVKSCISKALKGKPRSEESKLKQSLAMKGKPGPNKGKKFSIEHRFNLSIGHVGTGMGEVNGAWRGGASRTEYPLGWTGTYREQIRFRDGYKCQLCGCHEVECNNKLHVHHIDYNKDNLDSRNLISLCNPCHSKTGFKRDYWQQYFKGEK